MSYDLFPMLPGGAPEEIRCGDEAVAERLRQALTGIENPLLVIETYPGVDAERLRAVVTLLRPACLIDAEDALISREALRERLAPVLTEDRVFGRMYYGEWRDFFDEARLARLRGTLSAARGLRVVCGVAASEIARGDVTVLADITRWEIQLRFRAGMTNYHTDDADFENTRKFKHGYFFEWRLSDKIKRRLLPNIDFYLDADDAGEPRLIEGSRLRALLRDAAGRCFRMVPYFDPGVWGGKWMQRRFGLDPEKPNYAWSFDGVPEENSLLFDFGGAALRVPAINLVFMEPERLLGRRVYARFGAEFPIRFDLLDTMGGGNLSLQVHPPTDVIHNEFGMAYTQDESYYLLDAGEDACVYLGVRSDADPEAMFRDLRAAQAGGPPFPAEKYVNRLPAKKHDHFLIPAGTVHCSGRNAMVLEISATPYIFTMKMWDWGRVNLDGRPRPVHLDLAERSIDWSRRTEWVRDNLVNQARVLRECEAFTEETTGLHALEFIETRRCRIETVCEIDNDLDTVNVLNLVEGEEAVIESPEGLFPPMTVHTCETFIVPASVRRYAVRAAKGPVAVIRAFIRP